MSPHVTREPIDVGRLVAGVADPTRGATVVFLGTVRRSEADGPVVSIEYSAYEEMLASEFARIVHEVATRWPGVVCEAQHRLGEVPTGEPSIGIRVLSRTRLNLPSKSFA